MIGEFNTFCPAQVGGAVVSSPPDGDDPPRRRLAV